MTNQPDVTQFGEITGAERDGRFQKMYVVKSYRIRVAEANATRSRPTYIHNVDYLIGWPDLAYLMPLEYTSKTVYLTTG